MMRTSHEPVSRTRLSDQVALSLLNSIISGEVPPGAPLLTEAELCGLFGVSRTVIREAIRLLVSKAVVDVKQGKGMRVTVASKWDPLDTDIMRIRFERGELANTWREMIEARSTFEIEVAALAAQRRDEADLAALAKAMDQMNDAALSGDREAYRQADIQFHIHVIRAAHNAILQRILEPIHPLLIAGGLRPARDLLCSFEHHQQLLDAIRGGSSGSAREAMRQALTINDHSKTELANFPTTSR